MDRALAGQLADRRERGERVRALRRAASLTIAVGALHALLFLLSYWLMSDVPGSRASDEQVAIFYQSSARRRPILVGLYLMPLAGIAFNWFVVALRMWVSGYIRRKNILLSNIQLLSGTVYVALFFATAAAYSAGAASVEFSHARLTSALARGFLEFGFALLFVFAMRMAAVFVFTTSHSGRSAGILPRWFSYLDFVVGLFLLLSATFSQLLVVIFPLWLLALYALMLRRVRTISADAIVTGLPMTGRHEWSYDARNRR